MARARTPAAAPPGWAVAAMTRPWRYLVAVVVFVNGFAHLAGTTEALGAAEDGTSLDYLGGAWVVSDPTTLRVAAAAWALLAALFAVCAVLIWIADSTMAGDHDRGRCDLRAGLRRRAVGDGDGRRRRVGHPRARDRCTCTAGGDR